MSISWSSNLEPVQLNDLLERLESAFGEEAPFAGRELASEEVEVLQRVFADSGHQLYLQDQVNRQIIRDYLINAVMLGYVSEQDLSRIEPQMTSREGRAALSLQMLMTAVEQAGELVTGTALPHLKPLKPGSGRPPYIKLIET
jgi:hypothetical protein